jgi:hypothetical protein
MGRSKRVPTVNPSDQAFSPDVPSVPSVPSTRKREKREGAVDYARGVYGAPGTPGSLGTDSATKIEFPAQFESRQTAKSLTPRQKELGDALAELIVTDYRRFPNPTVGSPSGPDRNSEDP